MCLACEEAELYYRWQLLEQIAKGNMPEGVTATDLRDMGLPQPGEVEFVKEPDGTMSIRKVKPVAANAFVCDSPDDE